MWKGKNRREHILVEERKKELQKDQYFRTEPRAIGQSCLCETILGREPSLSSHTPTSRLLEQILISVGWRLGGAQCPGAPARAVGFAG